jgi:hypothetical protein
MQDPKTPEEWQDAVDAADVLLKIDAAREYGLVTGGPVVNVERCVELLKLGAARKITPRPDAVERYFSQQR